MSDSLHHAFSHPIARAVALSGEEQRDRISLRDHVVDVEIGAFQAERDMTQRISFNVVVEVGTIEDADDNVDRILSYDTVTEAIHAELAARRLNLLETLAENVAARILIAPQAERVFIRIEKLDRGPGRLGVEIVRDRAGENRAMETAETPRPRVVFMTERDTDLAALGIAPQDAPLILCLPALCDAPTAQDPRAARHLELLSIAQNAWLLAAQDARYVVVGSRTELDWAVKNGQISIWAPAHMVMDHPNPTVKYDLAPADLALWLAEQMGACEAVFIGEKPRETRSVAQRNLSFPAPHSDL